MIERLTRIYASLRLARSLRSLQHQPLTPNTNTDPNSQSQPRVAALALSLPTGEPPREPSLRFFVSGADACGGCVVGCGAPPFPL